MSTVELFDAPNPAKHVVEVMVGDDNVVRVNVDGICQFRIRMELGCKVEFNDERPFGEVRSCVRRQP